MIITLMCLYCSLPLGSLVEYAAPYMFPCFTSDFSKTAQTVELIFTLERFAKAHNVTVVHYTVHVIDVVVVCFRNKLLGFYRFYIVVAS